MTIGCMPGIVLSYGAILCHLIAPHHYCLIWICLAVICHLVGLLLGNWRWSFFLPSCHWVTNCTYLWFHHTNLEWNASCLPSVCFHFVFFFFFFHLCACVCVCMSLVCVPVCFCVCSNCSDLWGLGSGHMIEQWDSAGMYGYPDHSRWIYSHAWKIQWSNRFTTYVFIIAKVVQKKVMPIVFLRWGHFCCFCFLNQM